MSATAWVIIIYYFVAIIGALFYFVMWWTTRKKEDDIWRMIISFLFSIGFVSAFWFSYWIGSVGAWPVMVIAALATFMWMWIVFSTRAHAFIEKFVFAAFGCMVIAAIGWGAYVAGANGWWGMALAFYPLSFYAPYSEFVPD